MKKISHGLIFFFACNKINCRSDTNTTPLHKYAAVLTVKIAPNFDFFFS